MIVPGLEPRRMNDEELMRKISDLQGKMAFAYNSGNYDIVNQMQLMLESMQHEQQERMYVKAHEMRERMYKDVETEPDLRERKDPDQKKKSGKAGTATFFPPKTKKPGNDSAAPARHDLPPRTAKPT